MHVTAAASELISCTSAQADDNSPEGRLRTAVRWFVEDVRAAVSASADCRLCVEDLAREAEGAGGHQAAMAELQRAAPSGLGACVFAFLNGG